MIHPDLFMPRCLIRSTVFYCAVALAGTCTWSPRSRADDNADRQPAARENWPQWRGPLGTGEAPDATPPSQWSEEENKNIRYKIEIPGLGHSTPIVWGDRIFLTTAIPFGEELPPRYSGAPGAHDNVPVVQRHRFLVLGIDRADGQQVFAKAVREDLPHEGGHYTGSLASASPVTDGEVLIASFGSFGLYAVDLDGKLLWSRDFGRLNSKHGHGEGSSPALWGDTVIVNWDHEAQSFVAALDKRTGATRWKVERDEVTSWSSPLILEHAGRPQVIVSGTKRVRSYDLATGEVIWECSGLSHNIVATPVAADGMVFAASSYDKQAMLAIRLEGAAGDISDSEHVVWSRIRGTPYVPSPLLVNGSLYFLRHYQAILTRVDAATGEPLPGPFRLTGLRNIYASPVAAAGNVYITDRNGTTMVIRDANPPELIAVNQLDDTFSASAAIVGKELYFRGEKHLYAIAED